MKKHFAKILSAILLSGMVSGMIVGCGNESVSDSGSDGESSAAVLSGSTSEEEEKTASACPFERDELGIPDLQGETIKIWMPLTGQEIKWISNYSEYATIQHLQEALNVNFEFTHAPVGQEKDSFSIMLNSGNWPDIIWTGTESYYPGGLDMAMADGVMMSVDEYIGDDFTPNFKRVILDDEGRRKLFVNDNGQVVRMGARLITTDGEFGASCYVGPLIRKDYLEQSGLDKPVTIADWYEMLTKFKEMGIEIPYGWSSKGWDVTESSNTFVSAYGVNHTYMVTEDGKVVYSPITDAYKDYLTEMNKWYSEGLINPDFANQTNTDNIYPMLASDKIGALSEHLANYVQIYYPPVVASNPEKDLVPVQFPVLNEGDPLSRFRDAYYGVSGDPVITTKASNPEACVVLLDSLYNPEVNYIMAGTEGVTYNRGTTGEFSIDPIWYPNDSELDMRRQHSTLQWREVIDDNSTVPFYYSYPTQQEAFSIWNQATYDGNLPNGLTYTAEENELVAKYQTDIDTFVKEMKMKFMVGIESLDNFDAYVEQVKSMHIDDLVAVKQAALDRFNAR